MATAYTGFWEANGPDTEAQVATTITQTPVDELLDRLRDRLLAMPAGTHVRIDLIAWE